MITQGANNEHTNPKTKHKENNKIQTDKSKFWIVAG